jgi:hypothetical protein
MKIQTSKVVGAKSRNFLFAATRDASTCNLSCKSGLTEINKGSKQRRRVADGCSKPMLSHVVQRFSRMLSYVLVACHYDRPQNALSV